MKQLQKHVHSDYCWWNYSCWFGFPKPPSTRTLIAWHSNCENKHELLTEAKEILKKVQYFLSRRDIQVDTLSMEEMLQFIGVELDSYTKALQMSMKGTKLILKHNIQDAFINGVNINMLNLWGGNMDLQMVIDDVAAVMYVCSYMTEGRESNGRDIEESSKRMWGWLYTNTNEKDKEGISR